MTVTQTGVDEADLASPVARLEGPTTRADASPRPSRTTALGLRPQLGDLSATARGALLVGLVVAGAVFRLYHLGASEFSYDESFTAMAGRLPLGSLFHFLRLHDSHPPFDYLLHLPLARAAVSNGWFRLPGALCSIAAVALLAWWLRDRGWVGIFATAFMALSAFQIIHGRQARMYAEMELIGVGVAMLATAWLQAPHRRHTVILAGLVALGLLTHVSMFLLAAGLFLLPGRRTDRPAWEWRGAIGVGVAIWAGLWGPSFLVQSRGGHSAWIPHTTPARLVDTINSLVHLPTPMAALTTGAVVAGGVLLYRRDRALGRVWLACFAVPVVLAALAGLTLPVLLDRTLTLMSWAPLVALAVLADAAVRRAPGPGGLATIALVAALVPASVAAVHRRTGPDRPLRALESRARPGDVVAVYPATKAPELNWTMGVRSDDGPTRTVPTASLTRTPPTSGPTRTSPTSALDRTPPTSALDRAVALRIGAGPATGRIWFLDWHYKRVPSGYRQCAPDWRWGHVRILCLAAEAPTRAVDTPEAAPTATAVAARRALPVAMVPGVPYPTQRHR